jgi:hypothetical protein
MDRWSQKRAADRRRGRTYLAARRRGHRPWPSLRLVLAGELKRTGGDHRRAFDTYETRLRPFTPADGSCHGGAVAHELAIVALDGCMASAVADVLQVANGMVLRGGGSPVVSVRVATPFGGDATGFGCVPIRADASLAELGNVDVVVLPPFSDGLDDSLAAHPDLIVWLKSLAAEDVLLMSRKHPQRTPPPRRWWQPLNRHCAQTPGRRPGPPSTP